MGVIVNDSTSDRKTAKEIVTPYCKKNFPMIPFIKATGKKIAMMATVAAKAAKVISRAPTMAERMGSTPFSL
ncbi:hypothetical protein D3C87_1927240 [compost metagenome]